MAGYCLCSRLSAAIYKHMGVRKVNTSSYHPQTNGGTERVNHTMAQIVLPVAVNEQLTDWDIHLPPHIEFAYNNFVSCQATGVAPNDAHMGRVPRLPLSVFDPACVSGHQGLDRDQVAY